jgi:Mrp family chromosome partitioning ATPase
MTKHTPIPAPGDGDRDGADNATRRARPSLLERADAAFGLDGLAPSSVPANLPQPARRVPAASATPVPAAPPAQQPQAEQPFQAEPARPQPQARPEPRVNLSGPRVEVDREILRESRLIVPEDPVTGLLEEFRIIKREVLAEARASRDPAARRVLVSSPHEGEGKTFCAANLAISLAAERDVEILLVDADVINPSITRLFGIEDAPGLMDAIADKGQRPEELALATDIDRLFIMPAGSGSARDAEYLASARTGEVLDRLTRGAPNRFVIFDTPPALAASPAAELAAHVGQALLVVKADQTGRAAIEDARQLLSACPDLKLLLNAAQFSPSGRRFGDYREREAR